MSLDTVIARREADEPPEECGECGGDPYTVGLGGCTCDAEPVGVEAVLNELYKRHKQSNIKQTGVTQ